MDKKWFISLFVLAIFVVACENKSNPVEPQPIINVDEGSSCNDDFDSKDDHCAQILEYAKKLNTESESYYHEYLDKLNLRKASTGEVYHVGQAFPVAVCAITEALNHALYIISYVERLNETEDVYSNLQHIDGECFHIESYCNDGMEELIDSDNENNDYHITTSMKENWISVLSRLRDYSQKIREHVQEIRNDL